MTSTEDFPHFSQPPVTEVALSVQFEPLERFALAEIGRLQEHLQTELPRLEYHPFIPPTVEIFGPSPVFTMPFPFFPMAQPTLPRLRFIDEHGSRVLQFQLDRLVGNWLKVTPTHEYPRYTFVKASFFDAVQKVQAFLTSRNIGNLQINQCEITYINQIPAESGYGNVFERVFSNWTNVNPETMGHVEGLSLASRYVLLEGEQPSGRVYFEASSAIDPSGKPIVQLSVTGRGAPKATSIESAADFLDFAHDRIVKGFIELTTPEIQQAWGLTQ